MKLRPSSKLLAAALGLALSALSANAQFVNTTLKETATWDTFVGGSPNNVTNNGSLNTQEVVTTGTGTGGPFSITYNPITAPASTQLVVGTLVTSNLVFASTIQPTSFFSSVALHLTYDFDNNGTVDLTQNYTVNLSTLSQGGLTGVNYSIVPTQFFGSVVINGTQYNYISAVANASGTIFDSQSTTAAVQFQFIATPVPEPSTYALAGVVALAGIVLYRRRQASASMSEMSV